MSMASTQSSLLRESISLNSSSCVTLSGKTCRRLSIPVSAAILPFFLTYETEAGSSPTLIKATHGGRFAEIFFSFAESSSQTSLAVAFPSIIWGIIF